MSIHPILLDRRPAFRSRCAPGDSLLTTPVGEGRLVARLARQLGALTEVRPAVLPSFPTTPEYEAALRGALPRADVIDSTRALLQRLRALDPAEEILFVESSRYPLDGFTPQLFARLTAGERGLARHLVALENAPGQTREFVHADEDGRVQKIQRYYHPQTWPFATGVVCSLVPVACLLAVPNTALASLAELRTALMLAAVPSRDVTAPVTALDITSDDGMLHLVGEWVREAPPVQREAPRTGVHQGVHEMPTQTVAASARLVGPVVLERDVVIEAGALIAGPTLICAGARIGANAVVAQCVVLPGVAVPASAVLRQRVVNHAAAERGDEDTYGGRDALGSHSRVMVGLDEPAAVRTLYAPLKRAVEAALAAVALVALAPLLGVIAAAVRVFSPGPIFFGHEREGRDGRPFRCWKFRTMRVGADAIQRELAAEQQLDGPQFKMDRDPRVTPIGRVLRATNLDELPQLWNVLRGHMSFVGPRPSPFRENQICVPWRQGRLSVRPGITGLWQVCRHDRAAGDFHQWIEYDLLYVRHVSLLVDLRILLATVVTFGGKRPVSIGAIIPSAVAPADDAHDDQILDFALPRARARHSAPRSVARVVVALLCLAGASRAGAQRPVVLRPGEDAWTGALVSQLRWDSNARFTPPPDTADVAGSLRGELARTWAGHRDRLVLGGTGELMRYHRTTRLDRSSYDGRAEATHALSPRANGRIVLHARQALTRDALAPGAGDVANPALPAATLATARAQDADAALDWRLSARNALDLDARAQHVRYDVPSLAPAAAAGGRATFARRMRRDLVASAGYELQHSSTAGQRLDRHELLGGLTEALGMHTDLRLSAGAARLLLDDPRAGRSTRTAPVGTLDLVQRAGRTALTLRYARSASQAAGERGLLLTDFGAVRLDRAVGRSLVAQAGADESRGRSVSAGLADRHAMNALAGVRWASRHGLVVALDAFHTMRADYTTVRASGAMLSLGYAWSGGVVPAVVGAAR